MAQSGIEQKWSGGLSRRLEAVSCGLNRGVEAFLCAGGMAMALIVAIQVFCRYGLNHSLFWSEEAARYLLVWITFLGATAAYRRRAHPGIDILSSRLPPVVRRLLGRLVEVGGALFFLVMLVWGLRFAWFVRFQVSPALGLSKGWIYAVVPLSGAVFLLHALAFLAAGPDNGPNGGPEGRERGENR